MTAMTVTAATGYHERKIGARMNSILTLLDGATYFAQRRIFKR